MSGMTDAEIVAIAFERTAHRLRAWPPDTAHFLVSVAEEINEILRQEHPERYSELSGGR